MLTVRSLAAAAALATAVFQSTAGAAGPAEAPLSRVRATQPRVRKLLAYGIERSITFRALVDAIDRTDLMVYVEMVPALETDVGACLRFVTVGGRHRYLRISITPAYGRDRAVALVGHELQHALEVAADPTVRSTPAFHALFQRIGKARPGEAHYDTLAAQHAGAQVRGELVTDAVALDPFDLAFPGV